MVLPRIQYPLTREFHWSWFHPLAYFVVALAFSILVPLNYALTGYQIVSSLNTNFNVSQQNWYNLFYNSAAPGNLCDPHIYSIGDTFITNRSIFEWSIGSLFNHSLTQSSAGAGDSGFYYAGQTLENCDISHMDVDADLSSWSSTIIASIICGDENFPMMASTSFTSSFLMARSSVESVTVSTKNGDYTPIWVSRAVDAAGLEVINQLQSVLAAFPNATGPALLDGIADPAWCPQGYVDLYPNQANCSTTQTPFINISVDAIGWTQNTNMLLTGSQTDVLYPYYHRALSNYLQAMVAAVRIDMGLIYPNNFLVNTSLIRMNQTISPLLPNTTVEALKNGTLLLDATPMDSMFYGNLLTALVTDGINEDPYFHLPITVPGKSIIQVPYLCHFSVPKSIGQVIVAVAVATLSMFGSAWAVFMLVATYFAKRNGPKFNQCDYHPGRHSLLPVRNYAQVPSLGEDYTSVETKAASP